MSNPCTCERDKRGWFLGSWTPDRDRHLTQLWPTGLSITLIGAELGVSRNAVAGRRRRLKLPPRPSPIRRYVNDNQPITAEIAA